MICDLRGLWARYMGTLATLPPKKEKKEKKTEGNSIIFFQKGNAI